MIAALIVIGFSSGVGRAMAGPVDRMADEIVTRLAERLKGADAHSATQAPETIEITQALTLGGGALAVICLILGFLGTTSGLLFLLYVIGLLIGGFTCAVGYKAGRLDADARDRGKLLAVDTSGATPATTAPRPRRTISGEDAVATPGRARRPHGYGRARRHGVRLGWPQRVLDLPRVSLGLAPGSAEHRRAARRQVRQA